MSEVTNKLTRTIGKAKLWGIKRSPELLLAGGIISGVATIYFACKATLKASEIIDNHNMRIDEIHQLEELKEQGECSEKDVKVNLVRAYSATTKEAIVTFGPAIIFGTMSVTMILASHGLMRKRNALLAASLATVRTAFDEYRGRVIRDLGKPMDEHFLYDTVEEIREKEVTDETTGKTRKVKEKIARPQYSSAYSRIFDPCNCPDNFEKDGASNYIFIRSQMLYLQNKLVRDGYLFLNDVYKQLGFPITIAGQSAGWIYDYDNKENTCFAIEGFDVNEVGNSPAVRDLMNGYENSIILNFLNIHDSILEDIPRVDSNVASI